MQEKAHGKSRASFSLAFKLQLTWVHAQLSSNQYRPKSARFFNIFPSANRCRFQRDSHSSTFFFFVPSDTCTTACNYITYFYQYLTARDNLDYACTFVFLCSIATRHATVCIQGKLKFLAADFVLVGFSVFGLVLVRKYGYFSVLQIADLTESKSGFSRQRLANWRASGEIVYRARLNQHGNYKFIIDRIDMTDVQEWKTRFFLVFPVPLFTLGKTYPTTVTVTQIIERFYFYTQIAIFKMISVRIWITKSIWKQQTQTVIFITSTEKI